MKDKTEDILVTLLQKKGCEFIAHKLTGIKGTKFTAAYINRFHDMEDKLTNVKVIQQFIEQQIKTNQLQAESNQIIMERLEHLEKPARNSYEANPFLTAEENDIEKRKEELYTLTAELAELWDCRHTGVLRCLYNALEEALGIVLDCYKSVYRSETGRQNAGMAEVIASHDWIYKKAVKMCEYAINEKKIFK